MCDVLTSIRSKRVTRSGRLPEKDGSLTQFDTKSTVRTILDNWLERLGGMAGLPCCHQAFQIIRSHVPAMLSGTQFTPHAHSVGAIARTSVRQPKVSSDRMVTYKLSVQPGVPGAPEVEKAFPKFGAGGESDKLPGDQSNFAAH